MASEAKADCWRFLVQCWPREVCDWRRTVITCFRCHLGANSTPRVGGADDRPLTSLTSRWQPLRTRGLPQ